MWGLMQLSLSLAEKGKRYVKDFRVNKIVKENGRKGWISICGGCFINEFKVLLDSIPIMTVPNKYLKLT